MCTVSLAACLNHHEGQMECPDFPVCQRHFALQKKEGNGECLYHCPTVQLFCQDNPCTVTSPGLCPAQLKLMQGVDQAGYLSTVLQRVRRCWHASSGGRGGGSFPGIGSTSISPGRQCSPFFSINPSCSSADAALLSPHLTVYPAESCSL